MGSTWAFKITASKIKPTRETLLDYVSYLMMILSIVAIARVIIGNSDLHERCTDLGVVSTQESNHTQDASNKDLSALASFTETNKYITLQHFSTSRATQVAKNQFPCRKFYQSFFAYILAVESVVLLLVGILWVKVWILEFSDHK